MKCDGEILVDRAECQKASEENISAAGLKGHKMPGVSLSRTQAALAKQVADYLSEHMDRHITVSELSKQFHVSQTHLQNAFKGVYGVPVYSYARVCKMQKAAEKLIHTDLSVMEIAGECGYNNGSKFSAAFREIMGETPKEYRRTHDIKVI